MRVGNASGFTFTSSPPVLLGLPLALFVEEKYTTKAGRYPAMLAMKKGAKSSFGA